MAKKINWTLKTFKLSDLTDYYKNPRQITEKEFKQLKTSLEKFGMIDKPIVNADAANTVIGGHQRKHVLEDGGVTECECWVPDRELTDREVEELNIRLNRNTGEWNFDVLANEWDMEDLLDWGFAEDELLGNGFDDAEAGGAIDQDDKYTRSIEAPIYKITGDCPNVDELFDETRTLALLDEINKENVPDEIKNFLRIAAQRHTVLHFDKIAEFYAHAEPEIQRLMENSALVIIDFDRAIELGYVKLSNRLLDLMGRE